MVKVVSMRKTAAERRAEEHGGAPAGLYSESANEEDRDGIAVHLEHHHLQKMGLDASTMKHGDPVEFKGTGHVEHVETQSGANGERHHARIRLTHAGMDHEGEAHPEKEKAELRNEIEAVHGKSEAAREKRAEATNAKRDRKGEQVAEKTGG